LKSKNIEKIKEKICPFCNRKLKPIIKFNEEEQKSFYTFAQPIPYLVKKEIYLKKGIEYFTCRYCKIEIKNSDIRNNTIPNKFNEIIIKKREEQNSKHKYGPKPKECIQCGSDNLTEDPEQDNSWECKNCGEISTWQTYQVIFSGDIEVYAESEEMARELGWSRIEDAAEIIDISPIKN
jgi:hypothetical protein